MPPHSLHKQNNKMLVAGAQTEREGMVLPLVSWYSVAARFLHTRAAFRLRCDAVLTTQNANSESLYPTTFASDAPVKSRLLATKLKNCFFLCGGGCLKLRILLYARVLCLFPARKKLQSISCALMCLFFPVK